MCVCLPGRQWTAKLAAWTGEHTNQLSEGQVEGSSKIRPNEWARSRVVGYLIGFFPPSLLWFYCPLSVYHSLVPALRILSRFLPLLNLIPVSPGMWNSGDFFV